MWAVEERLGAPAALGFARSSFALAPGRGLSPRDRGDKGFSNSAITVFQCSYSILSAEAGTLRLSALSALSEG
jgi:hypothetical protein